VVCGKIRNSLEMRGAASPSRFGEDPLHSEKVDRVRKKIRIGVEEIK